MWRPLCSESGQIANISISPLCAKSDQTHRSKKAPLFDHLVGAGEQRWWYFKAEYLGGGEVNDEIELGRLLDRDVGRCRPTQHRVDIVTRAAKKTRKIWSIRHQPSRHSPFPKTVHGRQPRTQR